VGHSPDTFGREPADASGRSRPEAEARPWT
jgi:hypothetical protein